MLRDECYHVQVMCYLLWGVWCEQYFEITMFFDKKIVLTICMLELMEWCLASEDIQHPVLLSFIQHLIFRSTLPADYIICTVF